MKNSTIQSNVCQGENENVGQASHISQSSGYWFPIYEGIFEHCQRMSDAVWFFMWLIARTLEEPDGRGAVLGGISISDERPAGELGVKAKTISRWRRILVTGGYILAVRTSHGYTYTLLKSKKWQIRKKSDLPKQAITKGVISQNGRSDRPNRAITAFLSLMTIQQTTQKKKQRKKNLLLPLREKNPKPRDTRKHGRQSI